MTTEEEDALAEKLVGQLVQVRGLDGPKMLVTGWSRLWDKIRYDCMWFDREHRLQGAMFTIGQLVVC